MGSNPTPSAPFQAMCGRGTDPLDSGTNSSHQWYRRTMSTNLRLSEDLANALREEAARRGRSQQDIVRDAIAKELGMASGSSPMELALRAGTVEAPEPFRDTEPTMTLPPGMRSLDLLDREDR